MDEIEKLENRNRLLNVQIAQLNSAKLTQEVQIIINGHLQEIALNENKIRRFKGTESSKDD